MERTIPIRRDIHARAITLLIGCALLAVALRNPAGLSLQVAVSLLGGLHLGGGIFGSVQAILPPGKWAICLDRLVFGASHVARTLDDIASRKGRF